jgi:hypothetical protein
MVFNKYKINIKIMEKNTEKLKKRVNSDKHLVTYQLVTTKELDYTATIHETIVVRGDMEEWFRGMNQYGNKKCLVSWFGKI